MKNKLIAGVFFLAVIATITRPDAWAKPEDRGADGKGNKPEKAMIKSKDEHQDQMREKSREHYPDGDQWERAEMHKRMLERQQEHRDDSDASGLAKQQERKMEQEQKELDKGSEHGQQMREQHSRKWWRFWD